MRLPSTTAASADSAHPCEINAQRARPARPVSAAAPARDRRAGRAMADAAETVTTARPIGTHVASL